MILQQMQHLLAQLNDAPVSHDVYDFLVTDKRQVAALTGKQEHTDEQVLVSHTDDGVQISVYIDEAVLQRLAEQNPLKALTDENLAEYCTALEGISHFQYLIWSAERDRSVSLLELEVQAEVDKYAAAMLLLTSQRKGQFPAELHTQLFHRVAFEASLDEQSRKRYVEANRYAANFCRRLDERFLKRRRARPEAWLAEVRRFYRSGRQDKMRAE